jgi:hypothetical protein
MLRTAVSWNVTLSYGTRGCLRVRTHQQSPGESSRAQTDSRVKRSAHRPSRVQSRLRESSRFLVLSEQRTSRDLFCISSWKIKGSSNIIYVALATRIENFYLHTLHLF